MPKSSVQHGFFLLLCADYPCALSVIGQTDLVALVSIWTYSPLAGGILDYPDIEGDVFNTEEVGEIGLAGLKECVCGHVQCVTVIVQIVHLWTVHTSLTRSCSESVDCLMKSLILGRKQGGCTSSTPLPLTARMHTHKHTRRTEKDAGYIEGRSN